MFIYFISIYFIALTALLKSVYINDRVYFDLPFRVNKPSFVQNITILHEIFGFPNESIEEIVTFDFSLPNKTYDYSRALQESNFINTTNIFKVGALRKVNNMLTQFKPSYICLKNMYCGPNIALVCQNLSQLIYDKSRVYWIRAAYNGSVVSNYENIIGLGHTQIFQFGHFFMDILIPLLMFPNEVISKSYVALSAVSLKYQSYFKFIDFPVEKAIFLKRGEWTFASNLYMPIKPLDHLGHYGNLSASFAEKLRNYFNVTNIVPDKYYVTNRKVNNTRYINNMNEIFQVLNNTFPERSFLILPDFNDFHEAAYWWCRAKLVFGPTGSNLFKHFIMSNNTILVVIASTYYDHALAAGAASHGVYSLFYKLKGMSHLKAHKPNIMNTTHASHIMRIAFYFLDHGHYNPNGTIYQN